MSDVTDTDLPEPAPEVVMDANGAYWRRYPDHLSMPPVSDDNDPLAQPVAVYRFVGWEEATDEYTCKQCAKPLLVPERRTVMDDQTADSTRVSHTPPPLHPVPHHPQVTTYYTRESAGFVPECTCLWKGRECDDIVHAARAAKDHARMSRAEQPLTSDRDDT